MTKRSTIRKDSDFSTIADELCEHGSRQLRIALLFDAVVAAQSGHDRTEASDFVAHEMATLRSLGHEVEAIGLTYDNLNIINDIDADFVFNLCDSTGPDDCPGVEVIIALERRLKPFSGVGSGPYHLTNDKLRMKACLEAAGVPVPKGVAVAHVAQPLPSDLSYPLFVKPRYGYGSHGVDSKSRVDTLQACKVAVESVVSGGGVDALVEEFVDGREITVGVIGSGTRKLVLPPLEIRFGKAYEGKPKVRMFDTKENSDSPLYWDFETLCPAPLDSQTLDRVERTALLAYEAVGADGYGRVDIRLSADGIPWVLEVNANPCIFDSPNPQDSGIFPLMGKALGWSYAETLARIIGAGLLRPVRPYRAPLLTLCGRDGRLTTRSTLNVRKGALLHSFGELEPAPTGMPKELTIRTSAGFVLMEPIVRFMTHSTEPNVVVRYSRGRPFLTAARSIKAGEELSFDKRAKLLLQDRDTPQVTAAKAKLRKLR